jgi:hypothetical protein
VTVCVLLGAACEPKLQPETRTASKPSAPAAAIFFM